MLTLKAKYKDGQVTFVNHVPLSGQHDALVTFLASDSETTSVSSDDLQELKQLFARVDCFNKQRIRNTSPCAKR